jgi:hypothetical protein
MMGEYAELYTLKTFGVDISENSKREWKWQCKKCGKKLASKLANQNHMKDKHKVVEVKND